MLGPLCAFLSSLTWSIGSARYSQIARGHSIYALNFTRALVALPLFILATFVVAGGLGPGLAAFDRLDAGRAGWLLVSMVASYGLGDLCFFLSARSLGVPSALAIGSAYPVWTLVASLLGLGGSIGALQACGVVLVVIGVAAVILQAPREFAPVAPSTEGKHRPHGVVLGFTLAVLTSLFWALNSYAVSRGGQGVLATVANAARMVFALGITTALRLAFDPRGEWRLPWATLRPALVVFVLEAFGGSLFFIHGLAHSPLFLGTTLSALAPALSVPIAVAMGAERFSLGRTAAILLVLSGVFAILAPR